MEIGWGTSTHLALLNLARAKFNRKFRILGAGIAQYVQRSSYQLDNRETRNRFPVGYDNMDEASCGNHKASCLKRPGSFSSIKCSEEVSVHVHVPPTASRTPWCGQLGLFPPFISPVIQKQNLCWSKLSIYILKRLNPSEEKAQFR